MFDGDAAGTKLGIVSCLLLLAPMAGCLEPIGEATQEAVTGGTPAEADASQDPSDDEIRQETIEDSYEAAFQKLDPADAGIQQAAVSMLIEPLEEDDPEVLEVAFYVNVPDEVAIMSLANGTHNGASAGGDVDTVLFGSVHQTGFIGTGNAVMGTYNDSGSWEETASNLSTAMDDGPSSLDPTEDLLEPNTLFTDVGQAPEDADITAKETTYEGEPARQVHVQHANETGEIDFRVVLDPANERPLHAEGTFTNASSLDGPSRLEMDFHYGDEADHPLERELVRMESMTIHEANDTSISLSVDETQTWTIQPSQNPGLIPLEDVELQLREASGFGEPLDADGELHLALSAEQASASTRNATLVYDDVDQDGHVSPGDEIRFTPHTQNASSWSLAIKDEQTGMHMAPGPSLAVIASIFAGLAFASQRKRG